MNKHQTRQPSQRTLRVGELIRHALAEILGRGEIRSPILESHSLTVTSVDVSPDLKNATAYVMPLGGADADPVAKELNTLSKAIRGRLARSINLKYTPQIRFKLDTSFETGDRIDALLHSEKVQQDLAKRDDDLGET